LQNQDKALRSKHLIQRYQGLVMKYILPLKVLLLSATVLTISACAPGRPIDRQLVAEPDPISLRLASAVDRSSAALQTLAAVEQARTPKANLSLPPSVPQELRRTMTINWNGPISGIARILADRAGYSFTVYGSEPPVPLVVTVNAYQRPVVEILRDIGLQSGGRAHVVVDTDTKSVDLNYASLIGE
jgi:defect-in-organelle-trafficking protein DotD